jgi:hypothetical protein
MSNGEKRTASGFEKFVFAVTRVFALCGAAAVVIGIVILAMRLLSPGGNTTVSYTEVANKMAATIKSADSDTETEPSKPTAATVAIPDDPKPYFKGKNEGILRNWIEDLSEDQQKDFLKNMSQVVREAKAKNVDPNDAVTRIRH